LRGLIDTFSLYAMDTLNLGKSWTLTVSGRYNRTSLDNIDRLPPACGSRFARFPQRSICIPAPESGRRADVQPGPLRQCLRQL
jgi:outer membrane receptor for monomeric catechols